MINSDRQAMSAGCLSHPLTPRKPTWDTQSQTSTEGDETDLTPHMHPGRMPHVLPSKVKTSLCKNFTEKGHCPYGNRCQFAHGPHQLRINMQNNKCYKTKGCYAFAKKGFCYYGERCNFIHEHQEPECSGEERRAQIYSNHRETMREVRRGEGSRLMTLLTDDRAHHW